MIKDILGKIFDMKKNGQVVVKIEIEPDKMEGSEEQELKAQGMAPAPGKEEGEEKEMSPEDLMGDDEMRVMKKKKKSGLAPRGLSERVKMDSIEE